MSGAQPEKSRGRQGKAVCALLLATSIFALMRPGLLHAQETELRGEVSESAILSDQQRKARQLALAAQGQQAAAAETARARAQAASSVSGAPGTTRPPSGGAPETVRESLERALNGAGGARV